MPEEVQEALETGEVETGLLGEVEGTLTETGGETEALEPPASEGEEAGEEPGEEDRGEEERAGIPAEKLPSQVTKLLRETRAANPETAPVVKALQESFFRAREYGGLFKTIDEARVVRATVDGLGGMEGLAGLQEKAESADAMDSMVDRGDPAVIEEMFKASPEGFKKLVPVGMEMLEKQDPRAYEEAIKPFVTRSLQASNIFELITNAIRALDADQPEVTMRELTKIGGWLKGLFDLEDRRSKLGAAQEPGRSEIQTERQKLAEERSRIFISGVRRDVEAYLNDKIDDGLKPLLKGRTLSSDQKKDLTDSVMAELNRVLGSDKGYQAALSALLRRGDLDSTVRFIKAHADQARQRSINAVWTRRYGPMSKTPVSTPPGGGGTRTPTNVAPRAPRLNPGELMLPKQPLRSDLDLERDPDGLLFISGRGYIKSGPNKGKLVRWQKSA